VTQATVAVLARIFDAFLDSIAWLAAALLVVSTAGIGLDIVTRKFGWISLPWIIELVEYGLLGVTFLGAPWVLKEGGHVRVDILVNRLSPGKQRRVEIAVNLSGALICGLISLYAFILTRESAMAEARIFKTFTVDEWILFALAGSSTALMSAQFLRQAARCLAGRVPLSAEDSDRVI